MNQQGNGTVLLVKRLAGHVRQVVMEFLYAVLKTRIAVPVAARFLVMRLLTPFGFGRQWDRPGQPSKGPIVDALRTDGIAPIQPLPASEIATLHKFFCDRQGAASGRVYATLTDYFEAARQDKVQRPRGVQATGQTDCAITQVLFQDYFVDLAAIYLGIDRSRIIAQANMDALIRLDRPKPGVRGYDDALELHRDIDGYRFVKMFVYLTDCSLDHGHHQIYLQSHQHTPFALGSIARYSHAEVERAIPQARLHNVEGKAGFAFVENTYAFHRGTKPLKGDRLILNLQYMEDTFLHYFQDAFRVPARAQERKAA